MATLSAHRVSLAELTDFALSHQPSTQSAWAAAQVDEAGVQIARSNLFPTITANVDASFQRSGNPADNADRPGVDKPAKVVRMVSPSVNLSWVLFDFGQRLDGVEAARYQALASRLAADRTLQTVANQVEQTYFALLGARQSTLALKVSADSARESLDAANSQLRHGVGTLGDAAQADAALSAANLLVIRARSNEVSAAGALAYAVGIPVSTPLDLDTGGVPADTDELTTAGSADGGNRWIPREAVEALLARARAARPDIAAADAQVHQAQAQLAAARAAAWPVLSMGASANRSFTSNGDPRSSQALTLSISVPVFDGGLVRGQIAQSRARVRQLEAERALQASVADLDVWQSYQQAAIAEEAIASAEVGLKSALVAERAARARYAAGVTTLLEVLSTQAATAQARLNSIQARYDGLIAFSTLGYAVGYAPRSTEPSR